MTKSKQEETGLEQEMLMLRSGMLGNGDLSFLVKEELLSQEALDKYQQETREVSGNSGRLTTAMQAYNESNNNVK